jgi:hypothetical protein
MKAIYRGFWELGVILFVFAESIRQVELLWGVDIPWLVTGLIFVAMVLVLISWAFNLVKVMKPLRISTSEIMIDDTDVRAEIAGRNVESPGALIQVTIIFENRSPDTSVFIQPYIRIAVKEPLIRNLRRHMGVSNIQQFWLSDDNEPISISPGRLAKFQREERLPLRDAPTNETIDFLYELSSEFDIGNYLIYWEEIGGKVGTHKPKRVML